VSSQSHLLGTRRFLPLFLTQFLGAFNDNTFKNALVVLLTFHAAQWTTLAPGVLANLAAGLFILPFFLFSATAGQLADKFDKAQLARLVKVLEMAIMAVAGFGFWLESLSWLMAALFLLGVHSTLFGPVKYALLPQHLTPDELLGGNALVEAGTFVAILLGTLAGGVLAGLGEPQAIAAVGLGVAVLGYLASRAIPPAPAQDPGLRINLNIFSATWQNIGYARESRSVFLPILGISWFWLFGALFLAQFPAYAKDVLGGGESTVTLLLATFTLGVGLGSMACERLSGGRVELGLVPFGSIGLSLFALDLALASPGAVPGAAPMALAELLAQPGTWRILIDLALVGLFGGFFIVPLYALVQLRSPPERRARIIAANNIVNALFMVAGALAATLALSLGGSIPGLFAAGAVVNALVAVYIYRLLPEFLLRFLVWAWVHSFGRIRARGFERVEAGGAELIRVAPGMRLRDTDLLKLMAACRRPICFVLDRRYRPGALFDWLLGEIGAIRCDDPEQAYVEANAALAAGKLVLVTDADLAERFGLPAARVHTLTIRRPGAAVGLLAATLLVLQGDVEASRS
jgi:MFS family permease